MSQKIDNDLQQVIGKVQSMVYDNKATKIIHNEKYSIHNVTWEDCARNKGSVWGPCISDMTLQVGDSRMPVIRKDNFTDLTWDIELDKIPIVIGNEQIKNDKDEKSEEKQDNDNDNDGNKIGKGKLETVSLKEYLKNFDKYMSHSIRREANGKDDKNSGGLFAGINIFGQSATDSNKLNLLRKDESKDSHCIVSSQACFLPIAKGKETLFNVALFNYQSRKQDPAVLAIVSTSKGTSAQIIEGSDQKLLFNNNGMKADFIGQRLSDNRIERGVKDLKAPMTTQEKQDNCIVIIQVPLKQKHKPAEKYAYDNLECALLDEEDNYGYLAKSAAKQSFSSNMKQKSKHKRRRRKSKSNSNDEVEEKANIESAIVKVAPKSHPVCKCGSDLEKLQVQFCYDNFGKSEKEMAHISCDECGKEVKHKNDIIWHCKNGKNAWQHKGGYDLCQDCAKKQLEFDELNGMNKIERDEKYPIRVTLQYYKSTDNGVITKEIMKVIAKQLETSRKSSEYVGSLVTEYNHKRPTEWVKRYLPFIVDKGGNGNNNYDANGYDLIHDILGNLKLNEYYKTFVKNEINDSRLILLEDRDLDKIFDKIGPMLVFRHWLRSYKSTNQENKNENQGGDDVVNVD